jgi:DNA-directed RNA polymerase subunit M/transcription elongation factor TFIIS
MLTVEQRNLYVNKVSDKLTNNESVTNILKNNKLETTAIKELCNSLDEIIYTWSLEFLTKKMIHEPENDENLREIYTNKFFQIYSNLLPDMCVKNDYLLKALLLKKINIYNICTMTPNELFPKAWVDIFDKKKEIDKIKYSIKEEVTTDEYTCRRCKHNKCTYYQEQTRSGDESITTFITCINCQNNWRV